MESVQARAAAWTYPIASFFSAFLLFSLEPLVAKSLMPILGGSPAVWLTASAFFQAALLVGYAYAHLSTTQMGNWKQFRLHAVALVIIVLFAPIGLPNASLETDSHLALWQIGWMSLSIGPCFVALAATAPLLQRWYVDLNQPDSQHPYRLYAASNLGSFVGLAAYPLLLEPSIGLIEQAALWRIGFVVQIGLMIVCGLQVPKVTQTVRERIIVPISKKTIGTWILLAAIPSSLTLGLTQYLTGEVVSAPAFWAVPLALYLLSFVAAFSAFGATWLKVGRAVLPWALAATVLIIAIPVKRPMTVVLAVHTVTMFFAALVCHGEIARRKPVGEQATGYMLWISVGGVIGALFNSLLAPVLFNSYVEYPIVLLLVALAMPFVTKTSARSAIIDFGVGVSLVFCTTAAILLERKFGLTSSVVAKQMIFASAGLCAVLAAKYPLRLAFCLGGLILVGALTGPSKTPSIYRVRSFFGVSTVDDEAGTRRLQHGRILHGMQSLDPKLRSKPLTYYYPTGPIGQTILGMKLGPNARIAVIGLGAGSMAGYAAPGQHWDFYEIDPEVARIAKDPKLFTYLSDCKGEVSVIVGDGRLEIAKSVVPYDLIVLDAYSSDSVPVHLMTLEATELYLSKLKKGGVLAFHVSNRYFRLEGALQRIADRLGLEAVYQIDDAKTDIERREGKTSSDWVLLTRDRAQLAAIRKHGIWNDLPVQPGVSVWTDDRNSVFETFKGFDARY